MANTALQRLTQSLLTNKSGSAANQGDAVIVDSTTASSFTTTTTSGFINGIIGVVIEPNGIANNAAGMVAFSGPIPKINLSASASLGDLFKTHTVAGQAVRHAAPPEAGDFGIVLATGTTPPALLWGLPAGAAGGGAGSDTTAIHTNVSGEINGITSKATPVSGDLLVIEDSAASNAKKKITIGSLPGGGGGAAITESAYASPPGSPANGDVWLATDGASLNHRASSAWVPWGPLPKLTFPPAITGNNTTLNNGGTMLAGDTSCVVTDGSVFPAAPFFILIDTEEILVGAKSTNTLSSLTRGYMGTSAASHTDGSTVTHKNWLWGNQGTSTLDQSLGPSIVTSQTNAGQTLRALVTPAPTSTPYTITALVAHEVLSLPNYMGCGIGFRENSSGKYLQWGPSVNEGAQLLSVMRWNSLTGYTSNYSNSAAYVALHRPVWLRIKNDGSNLIFYYSVSGLAGTWTQQDSRAVNNFFTTGPTEVCMLVYQENGSVASLATFWSFEKA